MPTTGGFDHASGFNHPSDADFLVLEALRNRLRAEDSDDDSSVEEIAPSPFSRRRRTNAKLTCPVCKAEHSYAAPKNEKVPEENRYSHDARVIYASFGCPICLEDPAGPPMVVLPCGHAVCQDDFRLLGGKTTNAEADAQVRQAAEEVTQQHREMISRNQPPGVPFPHFLRGRDDMDTIAMAMMHAFASSLNEAMEGTGNGNRNGDNNNGDDDDDEESTDSDMPELIRPPIFSFDSSDDDMPPLRLRPTIPDSSDDDDVPPLVPQRRFPGLHMGSSHFFSRSPFFPAMLRYNRHTRARRNGDAVSSDESSSDSSYFDAEEDDDDDSEYEDPEEVLWRLSEYHPGNAVLTDPPTHPGFPRLGQWMLVPEVADNNKVNLIYYCEASEENNLFVAKQFPRGTKMIPNGKHGVYVYTPPRNNQRTGRRQFPGNDELWHVYYVKNSKPDSNRSSSRYRGRQESAQILSTTVSDPVFKYEVPGRAQLVTDGKGGIWALCQTSSVPEELLAQGETNEEAGGERSRRARELRLIHYKRNNRDGSVVGGSLPMSSKIYMDQAGGVILLQPNGQETSSSFFNLWHVADRSDDPKTLLYGGLPSDTKVVGDSTGSSVFLLSSGGRLQSILTRVMVEYLDPTTAEESTAPVRSVTSFSYDLDIAIDALQDIVDIAESHQKQVFLHARMPTSRPNEFRWKLCRVSPRTEAAGERDVYVVDLDVDCPRSSRIVSDRDSGVWVWKKPSYRVSPLDRCFVHVNASSEGQEEWRSPCVFPPRTHLAALG